MVKLNRAILVAGLLVSLVAVGGCGYKTRPMAPEQIVPEAVDDLSYRFTGKGVTLTWSFPVKTIRGTDLTEIASFDLFRAEIANEDYCPTCPIPFAEPIRVDGGSVEQEGLRKAVFEANLIKPGHRYFYKVKARNSWWAASSDSNIISFVWQVPVRGSERVTVDAGDQVIRLRWQPVSRLVNGEKSQLPIRYNVLRSGDGSSYEVIAQDLTATAYDDRGVENGKPYSYKVQSVQVVEDDRVDGEMSKVVTITAIDKTPPAPPTGVTVVATAAGNKIFWDKSKEKDLHGYRIYRRDKIGGKAKQIGDIKAVYTIFEDVNVPKKRGIAYYVTAYDRMKPANESVPSKEALLRH
ncbi:MAG: hypothetical protein ABFS19_03295 [Thermodesulfobacteriota bacterium]